MGELGNTADKKAVAQQKDTKDAFTKTREQSAVEVAFEKMLDPIAGGPATGKSVTGILNLFVDDLLCDRWKRNGTTHFDQTKEKSSKLVQKIGTMLPLQDRDFVGHKILQNGSYIEVSQDKAIDECEEIPVERNTKEDLHCTPSVHTMYRSLLGQINWLQSRTQFQFCYKFSRCASMAASPTIGDVKSLNKLARQI